MAANSDKRSNATKVFESVAEFLLDHFEVIWVMVCVLFAITMASLLGEAIMNSDHVSNPPTHEQARIWVDPMFNPALRHLYFGF